MNEPREVFFLVTVTVLNDVSRDVLNYVDCFKVIDTDPWGFPTKKICIYYAWRPWMDGRFHIISGYPYSSRYHHFLKARK